VISNTSNVPFHCLSDICYIDYCHFGSLSQVVFTRMVLGIDYSIYRYSPLDVEQLYSTKHNGWTSSKENRLVSHLFKQISSSFWFVTVLHLQVNNYIIINRWFWARDWQTAIIDYPYLLYVQEVLTKFIW